MDISNRMSVMHVVKNNGLLTGMKMEVYEIICKYGPLTAHEIVRIGKEKLPKANQTSWNARLSELENMNVIKVCGEKINPISNVVNKLWDTTENIPNPCKKTPSKSEKSKHLAFRLMKWSAGIKMDEYQKSIFVQITKEMREL